MTELPCESVVNWEWSIIIKAHTVLCSDTRKVITHKHLIHGFTLQPHSEREGSRSYVIYRHEILRLLHHASTEMAPRDALFFEKPCLMGYRATEVATQRLEWVDYQHEECMVLDAKKHRLLRVHLNRTVARHIMECAHGRSEGLVIENESPIWHGRTQPLSNVAVWYRWNKFATELNLYPSPGDYSPIVGRRFYIAETLRVRKDEPLVFVLLDLMRQVRHTDWRTFMDYVSRIRFAEDSKMGYDRFQNSMEKALQEVLEAKVSG